MRAEQLDERSAFQVLNALPGMGPVLLNRLLRALGDDPRGVLGAPEEALLSVRGVGPVTAASITGWASAVDLERERRVMAGAGVRFVCQRDEAYPPLLLETGDPPIGLYQLGNYTISGPCVAVVGSRNMTPYGREQARAIAGGLARAGFCVVSGLASGIDTEAHEAALEAGGATVAVLGNGIDIIYPARNAGLYRRIAAQGAVLSEFPLGRRADRQSFAMRNRIVAGMCRAVVVVESDEDGGSMITARFGVDQGRIVCAVPGRVDQPGSRGCHKLIRDGATLVGGAEDVLEELQYLKGLDTASLARSKTTRVLPPMDADETRVYEVLAKGESLPVDVLAGRLDMGAAQVSASLLMLEVKDCVRRLPDGSYEVGPG